MSTTAQPRHRKAGFPRLFGHPHWFKPKHCGGASCFHIHAEETRLRWCCPTFLDRPHTGACQARQAVSA